MAFDTFMVFTPEVKGESTDSAFPGSIEIYSFSFGASNPTTISSQSSGLAAGKVSLSSFNLMKKTDAASPLLFQACASGTHYDKVVISMRKAGGKDPLVFLKYTFEKCMIESIQWSGSTGGDDTPTESVSIAFGKVTIEYQPQDDKGAKKGGEITGKWNATTNKAD